MPDLCRRVFEPSAMAMCGQHRHRWTWQRTRHDPVGFDECRRCGQTRRHPSDGELRRDDVICSRHAAGESVARLAVDYRLRDEQVRAILLDDPNAPPRPKLKPWGSGKAQREKRDAEIVAAVMAGGNQHEIAARHGIDQSRVAQIVKRERARTGVLGGTDGLREAVFIPAGLEPDGRGHSDAVAIRRDAGHGG